MCIYFLGVKLMFFATHLAPSIMMCPTIASSVILNLNILRKNKGLNGVENSLDNNSPHCSGSPYNGKPLPGMRKESLCNGDVLCSPIYSMALHICNAIE